jgi:hypothetical protein
MGDNIAVGIRYVKHVEGIELGIQWHAFVNLWLKEI